MNGDGRNDNSVAGMPPRVMSFLLVATLLLSLANVDGVVAAFATRRQRTTMIPSTMTTMTHHRHNIRSFAFAFASSSHHRRAHSPPSSSSLRYKYDGGSDASNDDGNDNGVVPPTTEEPSTEGAAAAIKKLKRAKKHPAKKAMLALAKRRSHQLYKRGMQAASEEELAHHVQSIFSSEFGIVDEYYDEYDDGEDDDAEEEDDEGVEPFILSDPVEEEEEEEEWKRGKGRNSGGATMSASSSSSRRRVVNSVAVLDRHPSLVLNADYQPLRMLPLSIWSWQDTVKAVLSGKAVVVEIYPDIYVRAVNLDVPVPSVIALREYAPTGKARPAFTRRNVFLRDGYRCQYCSGLFRTSDLSLDHVEPRCLGGRLVWENTVTCCKRCNGRKGSLRPTELHRVGMELRSRPRCPTLFELAAEATKFVPRKVHATWAPYLGISPMSSAAVAVASSSLAGVHDDGRSAPDGDGGRERRKRMKKFRPYE